MKNYLYHTSCVSAPANDVNEMVDAGSQVTYDTMRRHCHGLLQWAKGMGYAVSSRYGLTLKEDWHVTFWRSKFRGKRCYYLCHSCIEYVWVEELKNSA